MPRPAIRVALLVALLCPACAWAAPTEVSDVDLLAHWKLTADCLDSSGNGHHGTNHAVVFRDGAACFDGISSYIEVPHSDALSLGARPFSVCARVHTEAVLGDALGDVLSKFSPVTRAGLNLSIISHAGMTSSQSNYRNLHFGVDDGRSAPEWTACGRPGKAVFICSMAVWRGALYAGTFEPGADDAGHVFRYRAPGDWADCGSPDRANSVMSMAVYRDRLYVGTARYRAKGSALPESPNDNPGGRVYRLEDDGSWTDCGQLDDARDVYALTVFRDELYGIPMYTPGVFRWDGAAGWHYQGTPGDMRSMSLAPYNGALYSSGNGAAGVWRHEGQERWTFCGKQEEETQTYAFAIYRGDLYSGTWPSGTVFRYDDAERWESCGRAAEEKEIMGMGLYNGMLYVGTLPGGQVFRYDGPRQLTRVGELDSTPDVLYRRVWTMAVHDGRLFAGTLPSGHVWAMQVGRMATHDHALPPGWRDIAAVRDADRLLLYVDGELVATSAPIAPGELDITNREPLRIGFGCHDYLNGRLRDVRLYGEALSAAEVRALHGAG